MNILFTTDIFNLSIPCQFGAENESQTAGTIEGVGATIATNTEAAPSPFGGNFFTMLMLLLVFMIIFSFFGGRKQKKRRAAMLDSLQKRDKVITRGGVFGTIVEVKPDRVVLKVDESSNTRMTVLRESVEQVTADSTTE